MAGCRRLTILVATFHASTVNPSGLFLSCCSEDSLVPSGWLRLLWVDGSYTGDELAQWFKRLHPKLATAVVKRSDDSIGFKVLPCRWIVEQTFGWLIRQRRLVRDYVTTEASAEAWIYIAMMRTQLRGLA